MEMIGYGTNHSGDTYKMFDPVAHMMQLSRNIKWLAWAGPDHHRTLSIFNQQPELEYAIGINEKKLLQPPLNAPNVIPDDNRKNVSFEVNANESNANDEGKTICR
jgi:hypothetical protein